MLLLPVNAKDRERTMPTHLKELRSNISFDHWNIIDFFMSAFKIKKPEVKSGEFLTLNDDQRKALKIKKEVVQIFTEILKQLNIDMNCLKGNKELTLQVYGAISEKITKYFYVRYQDYSMVSCTEILDEEYGLTEEIFSKHFPQREKTCIPIFSTQGKYFL